MDFSKFNIEVLKALAGGFCIDIFNDFEEEEVLKQSLAIQRAWHLGKAIHKKTQQMDGDNGQ